MKKIVIILGVFIIGLAFFPFSKANAIGSCYCVVIDENTMTSVASCKSVPAGQTCGSTPNCEQLASDAACDARVAANNQGQQGNVTTPPSSGGTAGGGVLQSKIIPECALQDVLKLDGPCGDITIFLELMFNIINYLFGIIGSVALLFFIYGGFIFILSEGNAERVAQGKSIIMSAVLGIIVAFSGYALVKFVGSVIGINQEYRLDAPAATRR